MGLFECRGLPNIRASIALDRSPGSRGPSVVSGHALDVIDDVSCCLTRQGAVCSRQCDQVRIETHARCDIATRIHGGDGAPLQLTAKFLRRLM